MAHLEYVLGVAEAAICRGERHLLMASPAVLALEYFLHIVDLSPVAYSENLRMAELAAIPNCVFLVREEDIGHPGHFGGQPFLFRNHEVTALDGHALEVV